MKNEIDFSRLELFAHELMGKAIDNDYIDWAIKELMAGNSTLSINIIAGLQPPYNSFEIAEYVKKAIKELNIEIHLDSIIDEFVNELANRKLMGKIGSEELIKEIDSILIYTNYDSKYNGWLNLVEFFDDYYVLGDNNLENDIIEECKNQVKHYND